MTVTTSDIPIVDQLENSEAFNKTVLESSPDCLKILDLEGRLQYMNFNGLCHMEIDDFTGFKGQLWWDLWGKENEKLVKEAVGTALNGQATQFSAFCPTAKGTPKWWHVTITPVAYAGNAVYQLLSVSRDITDQKNAEQEIINLNNLLEEKVKVRTEELLEKNIELERTNSELAIFNHIASHDLQEPLRKIQIFSKLILEAKNDTEETRKNFSRILDATERMRNLIDDLHKFSISKNAEIIHEKCDLNKVIANVIEYSQYAIDEKKATVSTGKFPTITGSKVLITQLIVNLLENSLKYSRENVAPHIRFSSEVIAAADLNIPIKENSEAFCVVKIEDNGIGFQNEYRHQIFDIFKRLHAKDQFSGTGIGLAICKTIVQKHNGWIEAESNSEVGSTFIIYFPIA